LVSVAVSNPLGHHRAWGKSRRGLGGDGKECDFGNCRQE